MSSFKYKDAYINNYYSIVGLLEKEGHLKKYDSFIEDYYYKEKSFIKAEIKMQRDAFLNLLNKSNKKINDISLIIGGDLNNQLVASYFSMKEFDISHLGIYSACASFPESIIIASSFLNNGLDNIVCNISSHNLTAERQFRYPIEYGALKKHTTTFTTTAAISTLISKKVGKIKVESATIGKVVDMNMKDSSHVGSVMAPAAVSVLHDHLTDLKRDVNYYDLILTGDLGCIGHKIFLEYYEKLYGVTINNSKDAGCELYLKSQDTYSG